MNSTSPKPKKILFTGGGSAGHVTPNLALIKKFQEAGWQVEYVGSTHGIESTLLSECNIVYHTIITSKLRRYFSWQNFLTPLKVLLGIAQATRLCYKIKPALVFSKGGFVAFPVVVGAWLNRIPIVAHESDLTPGLANKMTFPFAKKICVTFPEGAKYFKNQQKVVVTGTPIRPEFFLGNSDNGRKFCGFDTAKPIILVYGGGLGSEAVNRAIRSALPQLLGRFQIVHLCGKNKVDATFSHLAGYKQFAYLHHELYDVMACADMVISRAGANSIYELLALQKPHILIPLPAKASRGDQLANAAYFQHLGLSKVLAEESLSNEQLLATINEIQKNEQIIKENLANFLTINSVDIIYNLLLTLYANTATSIALTN